MICDEPRYYERYNETGKIIKSDALGGPQFLGRAGGWGTKQGQFGSAKKTIRTPKKPRQLIFNDLQKADSTTQNFRIVLIRHKYVEHLFGRFLPL